MNLTKEEIHIIKAGIREDIKEYMDEKFDKTSEDLSSLKDSIATLTRLVEKQQIEISGIEGHPDSGFRSRLTNLEVSVKGITDVMKGLKFVGWVGKAIIPIVILLAGGLFLYLKKWFQIQLLEDGEFIKALKQVISSK